MKGFMFIKRPQYTHCLKKRFFDELDFCCIPVLNFHYFDAVGCLERMIFLDIFALPNVFVGKITAHMDTFGWWWRLLSERCWEIVYDE